MKKILISATVLIAGYFVAKKIGGLIKAGLSFDDLDFDGIKWPG